MPARIVHQAGHVSVIFDEAAALWQEMSLEFMQYQDAAYNKALEATSGVLVNKAGREQYIDGFSLFRSPRAYARKYASEELLEHWEQYPRLTMAEFEAQWYSGRMESLN